MPKTITVGVITHAQGAHLDAYFAALAQSEETGAVVLSDPSGQTVARARKALGNKLKETFKDPGTLLKQHQPAMALVSMEAALAPPAIDQALEAGCHVFAEKPSCVRAADFEKLVRKAQTKHRYLMLALATGFAWPASRTNPWSGTAPKTRRRRASSGSATQRDSGATHRLSTRQSEPARDWRIRPSRPRTACMSSR
jgi:predicted dehydrogenase